MSGLVSWTELEFTTLGPTGLLVSWAELEFTSLTVVEASISWAELEADPPGDQQLYPTSDVVVGGWSTAPLWSKLNVQDTLTFITSTGTSYAELALANPTSVGAGTVAIEIAARKSNNGANTLVVTLVEGNTIRAAWTIILLSTTFTTYTLTLSSAEVASIVDWNNLRVRISHPEGS